MKWYKKQMAELLKKQQSDDATKKAPPKSLPKPKKVIHHGLEKRSRPKTDSIS